MSNDLDELEESLEPKSAEASRRLTPAEWEQIKTLWELGSVTLRDLSTRFGIRADTIQRRLASDGIVKGSRAHEIGQAVTEEVIDQAKINAERILKTKEEHYKYAEALAKLVMKTVIDQRQANGKFAMIDGCLAALGKAAKALEILRKERYALLGLDKDDNDAEEMPELLISEMTPGQIADLQATLRSADTSGMDLSDFDDIVVENSDDLDDA